MAIKFIERRRRLVACGILMLSSAFAIVMFTFRGPSVILITGGATFGMSMTAVVWLNRSEWALRWRVALGECLLCLTCCYDLRGHSESGRCPECGDAYDAEQVMREWRAFRPK